MKQKLLASLALVAVLVLGITAPVSAAVPVPTTASGFTQMFADKNDMTWSGGDQMTSFKAPNGKVYWLSGDTMLSNGEDPDGSYPDGTQMVSNRILLQQGGSLVNAMANGGLGVPNPSTHTPENQERYWPSAIFYANGHMYVLCQRVMSDPSAEDPLLAFKLIGSELAKYKVATNGKLTFVGMRSIPSTGVQGGAGPQHTQWTGDAIIKDGYVYIYGTTLAPKTDPQYIIHYTYLARVPTNKLETPSAWRYYKKSTNQWVSSVSQLSNEVNNPDALVGSQVTSVRLINGKFVMLHKPWNGWGSAVHVEVGNTPWGPFTTTHVLDSPAGTWEGRNYVTYGPTLHPEQILGGAETGKILISINWNGVDFWTDTLANADLAKPRFYSISY